MDTFGLRIIASDKVFFNGRCRTNVERTFRPDPGNGKKEKRVPLRSGRPT